MRQEEEERIGTKGRKGRVDERKGRVDEGEGRERCRGPEGEPISARMGSLVYISSFVSHPPPHLKAPVENVTQRVHATDRDPSPRTTFCPSVMC